MRKSRFLLSLIAATAIGLSVVGCDSSSSGSIADTTDLNNNNNANERRSLREYMLVAQRGLDDGLTPEFGAGQSAPAGAGTVAVPGDDDVAAVPPQLYELAGIGDTPNPNANLTTPGDSASQDPNVPDSNLIPSGAAGFHQVYTSPRGEYAIGIGRSKDRGFVDDTITSARLQIFSLLIEEPLDVTFPPNIVFGPVADPVSILNYPPDQGEFVSGTWSLNAQQFYVGIDQGIDVFAVDGTVGRLDIVQSVPFPIGTGPINNPVKILTSPSGDFLYALDNANAQLITYARNAADGTLTQVAASNIVSDPRGCTLDRSGRFFYVVGRSSEQVAGYAVQADGSLTPIDLFPDNPGIGPVPFNFGEPLGDIAVNSQIDQLFLTTYLGVMQSYSINTTTGALTPIGTAALPLGDARNSANIEVEPTGRFVISAFEHDFDSFQPFANPANGWPFDEGTVFANLDSASNDVFPFSATPNLDALGRIVYILPTDTPFEGGIQVYRIQGNGVPRAEQSQPADNPYGLAFLQKVLDLPGGIGNEP